MKSAIRNLEFAILAMAFFGGGAAFAAATITVDRVQQRYPFSAVTDIDYTISGRGSDYDCDYNVILRWTYGEKTAVMTNFLGVASCDMPVANGSHRVAWNATADGIDFGPTNATITAQLVRQVVTSSEADYIIIDLSSGCNSSDYPARYVNAGFDYATANFDSDLYKTSKLVLKRVPAGEFWMGSGNVSSGTSRHRVRHSRPFWLGIFEVSQGQYKLVTNANPSDFTTDSATEKAAARPVNKISYDVFCNPNSAGFVTRLENRATFHGTKVAGFCLPTEAQWEYCARAGTQTAYWWGDTLTDFARSEYEWDKNSPNCNAMPHASGLKQPNPWGFYDMLGNVWEWTRDWNNSTAGYSETEVSVDPELTKWAAGKVMRGGCFHYNYSIRGCGVRYTDQTAPNITGAGYNPPLFAAYGCRLCREEK